jgi:cell fate regulator YaaT (PSP1 superfamily)
MIARREPLASTQPAAVSDQYVVAFGKSGGLGCFTVIEALELSRGEQVVVRTPRGLEAGEVLGPATLRQARLIGASAAGEILRRCTAQDETIHAALRSQADALFSAGRAHADALGLPLQILDAEMLLDGRHAIVQFVGGGEADVAKLAESLRRDGDLEIRFENLATPTAAEPESHGGCGKPDCGRVDGGGGCTTCGTDGGCSSCGAGKVDLRPFFAHLRDKMEATHRTPLV